MVLTSSYSELPWTMIILNLAGGLALFLFGMERLSDALKVVAGDRMKDLLLRLTTNRVKAVFTGTVVTSLIQSSTITTVLVIGFISAGLMTLPQSIGVIMGANIGTTITAQIIAFKITQYALGMIAAGFAVQFLSRHEPLRHTGSAVMSLGLVFFGLNLMSDATTPLRTFQPFINVMTTMSNPWAGIVIGTVVTLVVQSSSATTGIIIVLASQGFLSLEAGIALAFGSHIGTCGTAVLAAIGRTREAMQAALVHVIFNVLGVLIWVAFIPQLAEFVRYISPAAEELDGVARLAAETPRQIANAHTIAKVANVCLFIWFTTPLAKLVRWLAPVRIEPASEARISPKYLDALLIETPPLALESAKSELGRMGDVAMRMVRDGPTAAISGTRGELDDIARMDDDLDTLHSAIVIYLGRLSQRELSREQTRRFRAYIAAGNNIENIGDTVEKNIVALGLERIAMKVNISDATRRVIEPLHVKVQWTFAHALRALDQSDTSLAMQVIDARAEINELAAQAQDHVVRRLAASEAHRSQLFRIESDLIEHLKRLYYFSRRMSSAVVEMQQSTVQEVRT